MNTALHRYRLTALAACLAMLTGCSALTRSDYQAPELDVPVRWQAVSVTDSVSLDPWWVQFHNPELNHLIEQALQTNNDLTLATLTLRQARLEAGLARDDLFPQLSASALAATSKPLTGGNRSDSFSASASVSYELDLWGRVSASIDAAKWSAIASAQDRESTAQSLAATTASLYWKAGYLNDRIALSSQSISDARQTLALTQKQFRSGAVSRLDVLEAQRTLASLQSTHSELLQQKTEARNALAILFNQAPGNLDVSIRTLPADPLPAVAAGIPADLLVRRPDVKSALYSLKSALASKDATVTGYFPALTLTGSVGDSSSQLKELLRDPVGTLGAELVLPFLQWNQMEINKQISEVKYQAAVVTYRKTLYEAFEDVDNALSARENYRYQGLRLLEQYDNARAAEKIYESQYRNGAIPVTDWLNAQETRRSAQASLLKNRYNQYVNQATLYQALGGSDIAPPLQK